MRKLIITAAALLLTGAAPTPTPLADFVRAVLPFASTNFASLRGAETKNIADTVFAGYSLRLAPGICARCFAYDFYAYGNSSEFWDAYNQYAEDPNSTERLVQATQWGDAQRSPPEWSVEKTEAYVVAQLTPLLTNFSLRRTTSPGVAGELVLTDTWRNRQNVWVRAKIYAHAFAGFVKVGLRVGHDVSKNVHVLRPASTAQLAQMQSDIDRFVRSGVAAAASDFAVLRGPVDNDEHPTGHVYRVPASFGQAFRSCEITDTVPYGTTATGTEWGLSCSTFPALGNRTSQEELVRSAISNALPAAFGADAADAKAHGYDYEWKSRSGVSVVIYWGDPQRDIVSFTVRISHFVRS